MKLLTLNREIFYSPVIESLKGYCLQKLAADERSRNLCVALKNSINFQLSAEVHLFVNADLITSAQASQGLKHALTEGSNGILNTGSKAQRVLQVRLLHQQLPVRNQLRCSGQQGGDTVHKLWHQTGVGVVSLTEMVCYHLGV